MSDYVEHVARLRIDDRQSVDAVRYQRRDGLEEGRVRINTLERLVFVLENTCTKPSTSVVRSATTRVHYIIRSHKKNYAEIGPSRATPTIPPALNSKVWKNKSETSSRLAAGQPPIAKPDSSKFSFAADGAWRRTHDQSPNSTNAPRSFCDRFKNIPAAPRAFLVRSGWCRGCGKKKNVERALYTEGPTGREKNKKLM